jgi:hypothetical protein
MIIQPHNLHILLLLLALLASPALWPVACRAAGATIAASPSIEPVANIGGQIDAIAVRDTVAFAGEGATLSVLDIHDPAHSRRLASLQLPSVVRDLELVGNLVYIATRNHGLQIVDISVPAYPLLVASYMVPGSVTALDVEGNLAYVSAIIDSFGNSVIHILDLTNPVVPILRSSFPVLGASWHLQAVGRLLYIPTRQSLRIMDVHNSAAPKLLSDYGLPDSPQQVRVVSNLAYVVYINSGSFGGGVRIVDVTNPVAPRLLGNYATPSTARSIDVINNRGYLVDDGGLQILDVHDSAHPTAIGSSALTFSNRVHVVGNLAYIAWYRGIQILDISNPAEVTVQGGYATPRAIGGLKVANDSAYVFTYTGRLEVFDISNPERPSLQGSYDRSGYWGGAEFVGDLGYLPIENGLQILNVSDRAHFTVLSSIAIQGNPSFVTIAGDLAYLATYDNIQILDVHNPANPALLSTYPLSESGQIYVEHDRAYVITPAGLYILDVRDPTIPKLLGSLVADAESRVLAVENGLAYTTIAGGIKIMDVRNPATPVQLGQYLKTNATDDISSITVSHNVAYVGLSDAPDYTKFALQIVDVHNPINPTLFASYNIADISGKPVVAKDMLYIPGGDAGLQIVRAPIDLIPASATITPAGGQIASTDELTLLQLPAGTLTNTAVLTYTGMLAPVSALGAGRGVVRAFTVLGQASNGASLNQLDHPATLTVSYTSRLLATHGVNDEESLNLAFWNGQTWQSILPCQGCVHDLDINRITVPITRLSRFALFGKTESILLPLVRQ